MQLLSPGHTIGAHKILALLGQGATGNVYLGEHCKLGRREAIKVLHGEQARQARYVERFLAEARAVSLLEHDNIVRIFDFSDQDPAGPYIVMELVDGEELRVVLQREGRQSLTRGLALLSQLASALASVHEAGLVHGDLKPANVRVLKSASRQNLLKLLDFGAAAASDGALSITAGTPAYLAPEVLATGGRTPPTARVDIYAFGVLAFEVLVGRRPFLGTSVAELAEQTQNQEPPDPAALAPMPRQLADLILSCLSADEHRRPESMGHVETALLQAAVHLELADAQARDDQTARRRRHARVAVASVAVATAATIAWATIAWLREQSVEVPVPIATEATHGTETPRPTLEPLPPVIDPPLAPRPSASPGVSPPSNATHATSKSRRKPLRPQRTEEPDPGVIDPFAQ